MKNQNTEANFLMYFLAAVLCFGFLVKFYEAKPQKQNNSVIYKAYKISKKPSWAE